MSIQTEFVCYWCDEKLSLSDDGEHWVINDDAVCSENESHEPKGVDYSPEIVKAYVLAGRTGDEDDFNDAYAGFYDSDADFAMEFALDTSMMSDLLMDQWPYTCIDWEHAGRELMYDYVEHNGYYFRNN